MKSSTKTQEFGLKTLWASKTQSVFWKKQFSCPCGIPTFSKAFWSHGRVFCFLAHLVLARRCLRRQSLLNAVLPFSMFLQAQSCPSGEVTVRNLSGFCLNWQGTTSQALSSLMRLTASWVLAAMESMKLQGAWKLNFWFSWMGWSKTMEKEFSYWQQATSLGSSIWPFLEDWRSEF